MLSHLDCERERRDLRAFTGVEGRHVRGEQEGELAGAQAVRDALEEAIQACRAQRIRHGGAGLAFRPSSKTFFSFATKLYQKKKR